VKEIVIVPAWRRPEFLHACLQRLLVADDGRPEYWICLDRGYFAPVMAVATWARKRFGKRLRIGQRRHNYRGNSYNVLTSYRDAVAEGADLVHLVEEDVFVGHDYFDFHRRAHALAPEAFAVSACRNQQFPIGTEPPADETAVYLHASYQSLGVSFRPERLAPALAHARQPYFQRPIVYCRRAFPHTGINPANAEQDGLLHRVMEAEGRTTLYAAVPRAYHAGFVGYHRHGQLPPGGVEARAAAILAMGDDELNRRAHSFPDHATVPLDAVRQPVDKIIFWNGAPA
jgi:hypothetical protein